MSFRVVSKKFTTKEGTEIARFTRTYPFHSVSWLIFIGFSLLSIIVIIDVMSGALIFQDNKIFQDNRRALCLGGKEPINALAFLNKFRLEFHLAKSIDFTINIVVTFNQTDTFYFGADFQG